MTASLFFSYNTHTSRILNSVIPLFHESVIFISNFLSVKTCFPYIMPPSKTKPAKKARKVLSIKEKI